MRRSAVLLAAVLGVLASSTVAASAATTGVVRDYASVNGHCPNPEGIAADPEGNIYTSSAPHLLGGSGAANVCVVSRSRHIREISVAPGPAGATNLLGELFVPDEGLYVVDFANGTAPNGRLLLVNVEEGGVRTVASGFAAANGIASDRHGNLYITDSFAGTVTKVARDGTTSVWSHDSLLSAAPAPASPFGANGDAFDRGQHFLYVSNTSTRQILRIPVLAGGQAGPAEVFASGDSINASRGTTDALTGADGIMFDVRGRLYVAANAINQVQVLSADGTAILARYVGVGQNALDFPAGLVFKGRSLFISNLSLLDGGVNSKVSVVRVTAPGLPLTPEDGEDS